MLKLFLFSWLMFFVAMAPMALAFNKAYKNWLLDQRDLWDMRSKQGGWGAVAHKKKVVQSVSSDLAAIKAEHYGDEAKSASVHILGFLLTTAGSVILAALVAASTVL